MSVAVANTTANVSGQTIELAERDQTITGQKTFDRDPSAPFVVSAGSAVVANLDADKLDGVEAASFLRSDAADIKDVGDLTFNDNVVATFGTGGDADIYYDATDLIIKPAVVGTGDVVITGGSVELDDSESVTLGTGKDATLKYDGTNLLIDPRVVGSGNTVLSAGDIYTTAWTDYTATSTIVGWSSFTAGRKFIMYKKVGKLIFVSFHLEGTSDAVTTTFTLPATSVTVGTVHSFSAGLGQAYDNSAAVTTNAVVSLPNNSATAACFTSFAAGGWTASGTKIVQGQFWYEAAS